jgi:hypothetical protein
MAVSTKDKGIVKIARATVSRIDMQRSKNNGHQLRALGKGLRQGLKQEFQWLLSPTAPLGIVAVPATLAWGVVAAPFCLLGDLANRGHATQQIKVI